MPTTATRPAAPEAVSRPPAPVQQVRSNRNVVLLAALGALVAGYLSFVHLFQSGTCAGGDCNEVLASPYAALGGVPLAALGLGLYVAIALAAWRAPAWAFVLVVAGNALTPYLVFVQAVRLGAWCGFCLASAVILLELLIVTWRLRGRPAARFGLAAAVVVAAPALGFLGMERALAARDARRVRAHAAPAGFVKIAGREYSIDDIDRELDREQLRIDWQRHRLRLQWVETEVLGREAEAQGLTTDDLLRRNVEFKVRITNEEIEAEQRPGQSRRDAAARVAERRRAAVEAEFLRSLHRKYGVEIELPAPDAERVVFNPRGGPETGPPGAPVRIVVFSDFQCASCVRLHAWLHDLPQRLGVEVRVAFRHFPQGPKSTAAAVAAASAHAQGSFWEFADVLFRHRRAFDPARTDEYAREAGLDVEAFRRGFAPAARAVEADREEGRRLGITATPALFINGVYVAGVPDLKLVRAILDR